MASIEDSNNKFNDKIAEKVFDRCNQCGCLELFGNKSSDEAGVAITTPRKQSAGLRRFRYREYTQEMQFLCYRIFFDGSHTSEGSGGS